MGNALAAQLRRGRLRPDETRILLQAYRQIPIQFVEVSIEVALEVAAELGIYAYDAYMVACALKYRCPLLTLDKGLVQAAQQAGAEIMEVE
ncbi:MAG: type II toxin-antitoxin system VapC family toxin [Actinomycetota bacterium]|nr:type II toxin-antitoxin system VapC family toxin [Actinomycetota bacterium]MDK1104379.1 type II toxin-antitoxin system VapC family toxin [Actinomycetota bacterium]